VKVVSQAHGVLAAPSSINLRSSTRSARHSTVSLDPNLDKYLRRRHQASVALKVAYSTERVALKGAKHEHGGACGPLDNLTDLDPFRSPFDRVARSHS
jgi:hypothetical protein